MPDPTRKRPKDSDLDRNGGIANFTVPVGRDFGDVPRNPKTDLPRRRETGGAAADATRVTPKSRPATEERLRDDIGRDRVRRDSLNAEALKPDTTGSLTTRTLPYAHSPSEMRAADNAQKRMNARSDSARTTARLGKKVRQELFDVEDDVDAMKKSAAGDLHRARLAPSVDNDFEGDADIERDAKRRIDDLARRRSTKKKGD